MEQKDGHIRMNTNWNEGRALYLLRALVQCERQKCTRRAQKRDRAGEKQGVFKVISERFGGVPSVIFQSAGFGTGGKCAVQSSQPLQDKPVRRCLNALLSSSGCLWFFCRISFWVSTGRETMRQRTFILFFWGSGAQFLSSPSLKLRGHVRSGALNKTRLLW